MYCVIRKKSGRLWRSSVLGVETDSSGFPSRICNMHQERGQFRVAKEEGLQQFSFPSRKDKAVGAPAGVRIERRRRARSSGGGERRVRSHGSSGGSGQAPGGSDDGRAEQERLGRGRTRRSTLLWMGGRRCDGAWSRGRGGGWEARARSGSLLAAADERC
jgi:hypothetical protein